MNIRGFTPPPNGERPVTRNITSTESDDDVAQLTYPPKLTLKRGVSETTYPACKCRRTSRCCQANPIDCPCVRSQSYRPSMSEQSSFAHTCESTPITSSSRTSPSRPPSPNHGGPRRRSVISQATDKLKSIFRSQQNSDDVEVPLPTGSSDQTAAGLLGNPRGRTELRFAQAGNSDLWNGAAYLPNVDQYLDGAGAAGPSSFYTKDDFASFQERRQYQHLSDARPLQTVARNLGKPTLEANYDADNESDRQRNRKKRSTRSSAFLNGQQFSRNPRLSIRTLWPKSRRPSKEDKGKGRQLPDVDTLSHSSSQTREDVPDSTKHVLAKLGILPPSSTYDSTVVGRHNRDIPQAIGLSPTSSIPSFTLPLAIPPRAARTLPIPVTTRRPDIRRVPTSSVTITSASSVSSVSFAEFSSFEDVTASSLAAGAQGHSLPIDCPPPNIGSRRASLNAEAIARPTEDYPREPHYLPLVTVREITESCNTSITGLSMHGDRPESTAPRTPPLSPIKNPSVTPVQHLNLGPPRRPFCPQSESSERVFNMSVDNRVEPAQYPSPQPPSGFSRWTIADGDDKPDFEITHPAPPSLPVLELLSTEMKGTRTGEDPREAKCASRSSMRPSEDIEVMSGQCGCRSATGPEHPPGFRCKSPSNKWWE